MRETGVAQLAGEQSGGLSWQVLGTRMPGPRDSPRRVRPVFADALSACPQHLPLLVRLRRMDAAPYTFWSFRPSRGHPARLAPEVPLDVYKRQTASGRGRARAVAAWWVGACESRFMIRVKRHGFRAGFCCNYRTYVNGGVWCVCETTDFPQEPRRRVWCRSRSRSIRIIASKWNKDLLCKAVL
jgi:hypothetical protein